MLLCFDTDVTFVVTVVAVVVAVVVISVMRSFSSNGSEMDSDSGETEDGMDRAIVVENDDGDGAGIFVRWEGDDDRFGNNVR